MFINIDENKRPKRAKIELARPNKTIIANIHEKFEPKLNLKLGNINELNFSIPYYIENQSNEMIKNENIEKIKELMYLKLTWGEYVEWFLVDNITESSNDNENMEIQAFSIGYELKRKKIDSYERTAINAVELFEEILEGTSWSVGDIDNSFKNLYRSFDEGKTDKFSLLTTGAETFGGVLVWDSINKTVGIKELDNIGEYKGFSVNYDRLMSGLNRKRTTDDIVTRLYVYGNEGLTIDNVNPTRQKYIEDYSYFLYPFERDANKNVIKHSDYMSDELAHALLDNKELADEYTPQIQALQASIIAKNSQLSTAMIMLDDLKFSLASARGLLDIAKAVEDAQLIQQRKSEVANLEAQVSQQETVVANLQSDVDDIQDEIISLQNAISVRSFTQDLLDELDPFIIEKEIEDARYIDEQELYTFGVSKFEEMREPKVVIETSLHGFLNSIEEQYYWDKLVLGDKMRVRQPRMGVDYKSTMIEMEVDLETSDANVTIANFTNNVDEMDKFISILYSSENNSTILNNNKHKWDSVLDVRDEVTQLREAEIDATQKRITAGVNESVEIGERGIIITTPSFPNEMIIMQAGVIALSEDGGDTWQTSIRPQGVVAETIIGKLIAGNNLVITNDSGSIVMDGEGLEIDADSIRIMSGGENPKNLVDDWNNMIINMEDFANDGIVTPYEKSQINHEWNMIADSHAKIIESFVNNMGVETPENSYPQEYDDYLLAYENLRKYLFTTLQSDGYALLNQSRLDVNSPIDIGTYRMIVRSFMTTKDNFILVMPMEYANAYMEVLETGISLNYVKNDEVVAKLNLSEEGTRIDGKLLEINSRTEFNHDLVMNAGLIQDANGDITIDLNKGEINLSKPLTINYIDVATKNDIDNIEMAYIASLSNDVGVIPTDTAGNNGDFSNAYTSIHVYQRDIDVTNQGWTFSVTASSGVSGTMIGNDYTVTGMSVDSGYVDITAIKGSTSLTKRFSVSKARRGATGGSGDSAKVIRLSVDKEVMTFNNDNTANPSSQVVNIEAFLQGMTGNPTFTATAYNGTTSLGNVTTGFSGTGLKRTLTQSAFTNNTTHITITATLSGVTDKISVVKIKNGATGQSGEDGKDSLVGYLTNEAIVLPAHADGVVSNYGMAEGYFKVYEGLTDVSEQVTYSEVSGDNITINLNTVTGQYVVTNMEVLEDEGYFDIKATYKGAEIIKRISVTKSKQGVQGEDGKSSVTAMLEKESHIIPVDENGVEDYVGATTEIVIMEGSRDVTSEWDISMIPDSNVYGNGDTPEPVIPEPRNLFVMKDMVEGHYFDEATGQYVPWENTIASGLIPITIGQTIVLDSYLEQATVDEIVMFDSNKNYIPNSAIWTGRGGGVPLILDTSGFPSNTAYIAWSPDYPLPFGDGQVMVHVGTGRVPWTPAPEDLDPNREPQPVWDLNLQGFQSIVTTSKERPKEVSYFKLNSNNETRFTVTNMTGASGRVTFEATKGGTTLRKTFFLVKVAQGSDGKTAYEIAKANGFEGTESEWLASLKGQDGIDGSDAKILYLSATAEAMTFNSDNTPNPASQTVSFTANLQNVSGTATFTAIPYNGNTAMTAITLGGSGNTRTLTQSQFPATATRIQINATLGGLSDTVSVVKLRNGAKGSDGIDGENSIVGYLTNESITVPATSSGTVTASNLSKVTGTFRVFDGLTEKTTDSSVVFSVVSEIGLDGEINSDGVYSISALTTDVATLEMRASYKGVSIYKTLTVTKARAGVNGVSVTSIDNEYAVNTSSAIAPTSGWNTTMPNRTSGQFLWVRERIIYSNGSEETTGTRMVTGDKGDSGTDGKNALSVMLLNESQSIATTSGRIATIAQTITIPFTAFVGINRVSATASVGGLPNGVTLVSNTAGTSTTDGVIILNVAKDANLGGTTTAFDAGTIDITITADSIAVKKVFNWSKSISGANGTTARTFFVESDVSAIIRKEDGTHVPESLTFYSYYKDGTTANKTAYARYWKIETTLDGGTWTTLATKTDSMSTTYTVNSIPNNIIGIRATTHSNTALTASHDTQSVMIVSNGESGVSIEEVVAEYAVNASKTTAPTSGWQATQPNRPEGQYIWRRDRIYYSDNSETVTNPVVMTGDKGDSGENAKLLFLTSTLENMIFNSDGSPNPAQQVATIEAKLQNVTGTVAFTAKAYNGTTALPDVITISGTGNSRTFSVANFPNNASHVTITASLGNLTDNISIFKLRHGEKGDTGSTGSSGLDAYTIVLSNESHAFAGDVSNALAGTTSFNVIAYKGSTRVSSTIGTITGLPTGMSTTLSNNGTATAGVNISVTTAMVSPNGTLTIPITVDGKVFTKNFSYSIAFKGTKGDTGQTGQAGKGISSTVIDYQNHTSGTVVPSGSWNTTIPTPIKGQYLWTRTRTTYTDNSVIPTYSVAYNATDGQNGSDGKGISSTVVTYQLSSSGTTAPTGSWLSEPPTPIQGQYLWTKTVINYTSGNPSTSYSTSYFATDGQKGDKGDTGTGVTSTSVTYQNHTSGTTAPTTWLENIPNPVKGRYLWTRTVTGYSDGSSATTYSVAYHALDGQKGDTGSTGTGVSNTTVHYQQSASGTVTPTGSWLTTIPTPIKGQYLWTRTVINYTDGTNSTSYSTSYHATDGQKGDKGDTGASGADAKVITVTPSAQIFARDENNNITPTSITVDGTVQNTTISTWQYSVDGGTFGTALPTGVTRSGNKVTISGSGMTAKTIAVKALDSSGNADTTTIAKVQDGATGQTGSKGDNAIVGYLTNESITLGANSSGVVASYASATGTFKMFDGVTDVTASSLTVFSLSNTSGLTASINSSTGVYSVTAMSADTGTAEFRAVYKGVTVTKTLTVAKSRAGTNGATGAKGDKGDTGTGIQSTVVSYQNHTSGTTAPTGTWSTNVVTPIKGQYLWTRTITTYTDNSTVTTYSVAYNATDGQKGDDGKGIQSTAITYAQTSSGTTTPTSWSGTMPSPVKGQYLWTRTIITYTDGTTSTAYSTSYSATDGQKGDKGDKGDKGETGTGVVSTSVTYQNHTSGTSAPSTWLASIPSPVKGQYLWTRTITNYSDGSSATTYSVAYHALDGQKGDTGSTGSTGVGVSSTSIHYQQSTNGNTAPTGSWLTTVPTPIKGQYLWTRTVINYTNGTSSTAYSTSYHATDGQKGDKGDKGADGVDGVSPIVGFLTNESITLPANSLGVVSSFSGATGTFNVYQGTVLRNSGASYSVVSQSGITVSITQAGVYTVSAMTTGTSVLNGTATLRATYGGVTVDKILAVTKALAGSDGSKGDKGDTGNTGSAGQNATSYWINASVNAIKRDVAGTPTPDRVTFIGYSKTGTSNPATYSGRFIISTSTDGTSYTNRYTSSSNQSSYTYIVPADAKFVKARFYQAGGTSLLLDEQTIPVLVDAEGINYGGKTQEELNSMSHIYFNNDGYIEFPDEVKALIHGKPQATIEFWNKQESVTSSSYGFLQLSGFANSNGTIYPYGNETEVYLDTFRTNRLGRTFLPKSVTRWHHFAVTTHPTDGWKLYQDGVLVTTATAQPTVDVSHLKFRIGNNSGNRYSVGGYRDIRLWDVARSNVDIISNMNTDLLGNESGLVGYWKVSENGGEIVKDLVNGNDGLITNGVWKGSTAETNEKIGNKADQENLDAVIGDVDAIKDDLNTKVDYVSYAQQNASYNEWLAEVEGRASSADELSKLLDQKLEGATINLNGHSQRWASFDSFIQFNGENPEDPDSLPTSIGIAKGVAKDPVSGEMEISTGMILDDSSLTFYSGGEAVAVITSQYLQIDRGIFTSSAQIGSHKFEPLASNSDHFILSFVGNS